MSGAREVTAVRVLVMAKAPVPGLAKTRLAVTLGEVTAAELAAAALLDTLDAVEAVTESDHRLLAFTGDLADATAGAQLAARLDSWHRVEQRGAGLAERLVNAHRDAAALWGDHVVVQIGTDTPQVSGADLARLAEVAHGNSQACALGPAADGGWWGLATGRPGLADSLAHVPMSRADTGHLTAQALRRGGATVTLLHELTDVDTVADAHAVTQQFPQLAFSRLFVQVYKHSTATGRREATR
ncbi:MAG: DUF2064 domain-containing protein [Nocardioidaceae bacterium]